MLPCHIIHGLHPILSTSILNSLFEVRKGYKDIEKRGYEKDKEEGERKTARRCLDDAFYLLEGLLLLLFKLFTASCLIFPIFCLHLSLLKI